LGIGPYIFYRATAKPYLLECKLCGYKWNARSVSPNVQIQAKPDLIQKGEQKLREEEEMARAAAMEEWKRRHK
jgi:hypothetical protein